MIHANSEIAQDGFRERMYKKSCFILFCVKCYVFFQNLMFIVGLGPYIPGVLEKFLYRNSRWLGIGVWFFLFGICWVFLHAAQILNEQGQFDGNSLLLLAVFSLFMFLNHFIFFIANPEYMRLGYSTYAFGLFTIYKLCPVFLSAILFRLNLKLLFMQNTLEELCHQRRWAESVVFLCGILVAVLLSFIS